MSLSPAPKAIKPLKYGIVIVCEDEKSNVTYLRDKVNSCKPKSSSTIVEPDDPRLYDRRDAGGTQTTKLTNFAISKVNELNIRYNNNAEMLGENFFREVYVIADVDDNEYQNGKYIGKVTNAIHELATAQTANPAIKYDLLLSNECFEIWYILHFQDITEPLYRGRGHTKHLANDSNLIWKRLGELAGISTNEDRQKKRKDFFQIMQTRGNEAEAIERAKKLEADSKTKNPTELFSSNPSTAVYKLIERLNNL